MCGITGFFAPRRAVDAAGYYAAHRLIRHRGPDDEGFAALVDGAVAHFRGDDTIAAFGALPHVATLRATPLLLGHRRLPIIDLSTDGHQPRGNATGGMVLTYNGELFNYRELREELARAGERFETATDTEVFLKAFGRWGTGAYARFNGMWAAAVYDPSRRALHLTRDRFGIKPLYYLLRDGALYFASEMKFLKAFAPFRPTLDGAAVRDYVERCRTDHGAGTFYREIRELPPGHALRFDGDGLSVERWWNFRPTRTPWTDAGARERFAELFENSLALRMRSDVEVGTLLSGGLDSSLIVATLNRLKLIGRTTFKSFTIQFGDNAFDERRYVDETLNRVPLDARFIPFGPAEVDGRLDSLLHHIEQPVRSLSVLAQQLLYENIRRTTGVRVVLNGQGSDELFGGYARHYFYRLGGLLSRLRLREFAAEAIPYLRHRRPGLAGLVPRLLYTGFRSLGRRNYFDDMLFDEVKRSALREYLKYDDRNSMTHAVEARVPFLDHRLVEFAFSLGEGFKIDRFVNKRIVRDYGRGSVPDAILDRTDKMGFVTPQEAWQRRELRPLLDEAFDGIARDGLPEAGDGAALARFYRRYREGRHDDWGRVWRLFCYRRWLKLESAGRGAPAR